jgi:predicted anti-sigma-YlaC factor YlaD
MNCRDYQQMISRLVDLELRAAASAELFEHLGRCAECREFLDTMMKLTAELDKIGMPLEFTEAVGGNKRLYVGDRPSALRLGQPRSLRSRLSTFALLIMLTLFIGLLFSVDISAQRSQEPIPQELVPSH